MMDPNAQPRICRSLLEGLHDRHALVPVFLARSSSREGSGAVSATVALRLAPRDTTQRVSARSFEEFPVWVDIPHAGAAPEHLRLQKGGNIEAGWIVFTRSLGCSAGTFSQRRDRK